MRPAHPALARHDRLGSRLDAMLRQLDDWQRRRGAVPAGTASPAERVIARANHLLAMATASSAA